MFTLTVENINITVAVCNGYCIVCNVEVGNDIWDVL